MTCQFIFFPFTHISQHQFAIVSTFFESFHYFSGQADGSADPCLNTLDPSENEKKIIAHGIPSNMAARIEQIQARYLDWVRIHEGNEYNLKILLKDSPYFMDDTQVTAIKSRLKAGKEIKPGQVDARKTFEQHLLFLKMAHSCDSQNENIDFELNRLEETKDKLLSTLRGLNMPDNKIKASGISSDPGAVMTRERIESWAACMHELKVYSPDEQPVFITTSQAVFDYLESICEDSLNALDIAEIKVHENDCENKKKWQQGFYDNLKDAVKGEKFLEDQLPEVDDVCSLSGQIKVSLFSGNEIKMCFNLSDKQVIVCLVELK